MTGRPAPPLLLFDGDCAFCSSCARAIDRWIPTAAAIVPWQHADLDALGVTVAEADAAVVWVADGVRHTCGPEAIADLLRSSTRRSWRVVGWSLGRRPSLALAWPVYRWIARNRHRMPGGTAQCARSQTERGAASRSASSPPS